jgi:diguanylate cyclase (GGDEF)-like protein
VGDGVTVLAQVEDVTDERAAEEALRHQALHDALTGLPNRTLVHDRIQRALSAARRDGTNVAVVFCDVDHFKLINDTHGHQAGDRLLRHVGAALAANLRPGDTAARLGGDEFVLVLCGARDVEHAARIADRLRLAVRRQVDLTSVPTAPALSMGVTLATDESDPESLLAEADAALYRAKALGRDRCEIYDVELRRSAAHQLLLLGELERAVTDREFAVHYQPIVRLDSGDVVGYEALLRWVHPERGLVAPADFLSLLVDSVWDDAVADYVLERACIDLNRLSAIGDRSTFVSINVSVRQLGRADLAGRVSTALAAVGLSPDRLWVEVTEQHAVDRHHLATLERLRDIGVRIAIDDFGTGYAGLTYLQRLPADIVKIDRSFVRRITDDGASRSITGAIADLSELLGLTVVAEGVETRAQAAILRELGVTLGQGYFHGAPEPLPHWTDDRLLPSRA